MDKYSQKNQKTEFTREHEYLFVITQMLLLKS